MSSRPSRSFLPLYVLAWLPLVALFTFAFQTGDALSLAQGLTVALYYTVPPAFFGIGVVRASLAMPWSSERRTWFFARHVVLAAAFAGLSGAGTVAVLTLFPPYLEESGDVSLVAVFVGQLFLGLLLYCVLVGFTYAAMGEIRRRQEAAAAARAETLRARAELKALRAQVNPHFLFNTLHSVLALIRKDPAAAEEALEQFGDLMRYGLRVQRGAGDEVSLAEEWAFARDYLALEKLRLGERLRVHADVDAGALARSVPAFSLQPLLENSIGHAIAPRARGGSVWIRAAVEGERLVLEVRDDGPGASDEAIDTSDGTGLRLLRRRLEALYGDGASLTTRAGTEGFSVTVELPATQRGAAAEGSSAAEASSAAEGSSTVEGSSTAERGSPAGRGSNDEKGPRASTAEGGSAAGSASTGEGVSAKEGPDA